MTRIHIQDIFNAGKSDYIVEYVTPSKLEDIAKTIIMDSLKNDPGRNLVLVYYKMLFNGLVNVRDGIERHTLPKLLKINRTFNSGTPFEVCIPIEKPKLNGYLKKVEVAYIQICDLSHVCVGLEKTSRGTELGRYDFSPSLNTIYNKIKDTNELNK